MNVSIADGLQEVVRVRRLAKDLFDFDLHVFVLRVGIDLTNESALPLSGKLQVGIVVVLWFHAPVPFPSNEVKVVLTRKMALDL